MEKNSKHFGVAYYCVVQELGEISLVSSLCLLSAGVDTCAPLGTYTLLTVCEHGSFLTAQQQRARAPCFRSVWHVDEFGHEPRIAITSDLHGSMLWQLQGLA